MIRRAVCNGPGRRARAALRGAVAAAILLCALPPPAAGQTRAADDDFRSRARMRAGPLFMRPGFTLDRLGIDTNVFNTPEEQSDFVVAGTPRIETWLPVRRVLVTTEAGVGLEYYRKFAGERSANPRVRTQVEVPLRRVTFTAAGDYLRTRERPPYEIDLRARRVETGLNGGVTVAVAPRFDVALEAARNRTRFDAAAFFAGTYLAETLNRDEDSARAAARWRRTALSTFVFAGEYREARFLRSPGRDSGNAIVTAGAEFHPRALISGSGEIGVRRFFARGSDVTDITRVVARADLTWRFRTSTAVTFEAERDIHYSFRRDDPFYVLNRYRIGVRRQLGGPFDVTGYYNRDVYDHQGGTGRRDSVWTAEGILGYRLSAGNRVGFRVRYAERDSITERWRYDGLEAGLVFDYGL